MKMKSNEVEAKKIIEALKIKAKSVDCCTVCHKEKTTNQLVIGGSDTYGTRNYYHYPNIMCNSKRIYQAIYLI